MTLSELNFSSEIPKKGDVLVIKTKKSKPRKLLVHVKEVVNGNEVVLQKSTNSFYNHDMYVSGESWVCRVWNLGNVEPTTSVNNMQQLLEL